MVGRFNVRQFFVGSLYRKTATWVNGKTEGLFPL